MIDLLKAFDLYLPLKQVKKEEKGQTVNKRGLLKYHVRVDNKMREAKCEG